MKRKVLKTAAFLTAVVLISGLGAFANVLVGNPVSRLLAKRTAQAYLDGHYGDTGFVLEEVSYSFKEGGYYATIRSPGSGDLYFTLSLDMAGHLLWDHYESMVASGENTARRLSADYRALTDSVFESPAFPYTSAIAYGDLAFGDQEAGACTQAGQAHRLSPADLEPDRLYDIRRLGAEAGYLTVYIDDQTVSVERAAEIMLDIKALLDASGIPFYAMHFVLQYPQPSGDAPRPEGRVEAIDFLSADMEETGMAARVEAANAAAEAYYARIDGEK